MSPATARRRGGDGRSQFAQGPGGTRKNRSSRSSAALPATLLADINPIEKAWAKLKQLLRADKARTKEALDQAIIQLLPLLTAEDAKAWFRLPFNALQQ